MSQQTPSTSARGASTPGSRSTSTGRQTLDAVLRATRRWVADNTFSPVHLPAPLRRLSAGYALAVLFEIAATVLTLALVAVAPTFSFFGMLNILAVALVALSWGAAPSLLATLTGTVLLEVVVLPQTALAASRRGDVAEIVVCLVVGSIISVAASGAEQARRRAVRENAASQARELALVEMNARTDEFVSIASHELRSPLTSLKAALQLGERRLRRVAAHETPPADLATQLESVMGLLATAEQQVERQNRLVGDLLDMSRIRANKLEFYLTPCDLATVVGEAVEEQTLSWPGRVITLAGPQGDVPIEGDAHRLGQVVTNFLTNALKYSPPDAPVAVSLSVEGGYAKVAVRDHGPGLSAEQRNHIWERFHRVPGIKQQSGSGAGLGLGLHIARTVVENHHGQAGIESAPGRGSTFWFSVPLRAAVAAIPAAPSTPTRQASSS
ncbi:MAG TPA: HAMP domain-containing sensor histidine kinase [Ktedonobacterales bacterium]|nr:HAMP domain-containing sensor histidine kinase [Ktedonobacterales bacterium]